MRRSTMSSAQRHCGPCVSRKDRAPLHKSASLSRTWQYELDDGAEHADHGSTCYDPYGRGPSSPCAPLSSGSATPGGDGEQCVGADCTAMGGGSDSGGAWLACIGVMPQGDLDEVCVCVCAVGVLSFFASCESRATPQFCGAEKRREGSPPFTATFPSEERSPPSRARTA